MEEGDYTIMTCQEKKKTKQETQKETEINQNN